MASVVSQVRFSFVYSSTIEVIHERVSFDICENDINEHTPRKETNKYTLLFSFGNVDFHSQLISDLYSIKAQPLS